MEVQPLAWWQDRATVTTLLSALLSVGVGVTDASLLHLFDREMDVGLILLGVGALASHNPLTPVPATLPWQGPPKP